MSWGSEQNYEVTSKLSLNTPYEYQIFVCVCVCSRFEILAWLFHEAYSL